MINAERKLQVVDTNKVYIPGNYRDVKLDNFEIEKKKKEDGGKKSASSFIKSHDGIYTKDSYCLKEKKRTGFKDNKVVYGKYVIKHKNKEDTYVNVIRGICSSCGKEKSTIIAKQQALDQGKKGK